MSRRPPRFTLKEVQTLVRAAQESGARLVLELDGDGKFRVILNETASIQDVAKHKDLVL